ncbi:MAG TPA: DUF3160 domain-containing protein [Phycisphaerae bacterium]|nr:DUF3160 domain-containing protein [Phycisphaerae bacterium]
MDCPKARDHLELYLLGELPLALRRAIEAHLDSCVSCRQELQLASAVLKTLDEELAVPPDGGALVEKIVARVERSDRRRKRMLWVQGIAAAAVAACIVLAVWLWPAPPREGGAPAKPQLVGCRVMPVGAAEFEIVAARRIRLHRGEILVDAQPAEQPFVVETLPGVVTAIGTRFYVKTGKAQDGNGSRERLATTVTVLRGRVRVANAHGSEDATRGESVMVIEGSAPKKHVEDLAKRFGKYYRPVTVTTTPAAAAYSLPLDLGAVVNYEHVAKRLKLKEREALLRQNGFVVLPWYWDDTITPYMRLAAMKVPIFVTTDALLHLYHVQFHRTLGDIEEGPLYADIAALSELLRREAQKRHDGSDGEQKAAARLLLSYSAVALAVLDGQAGADPAAEASELLQEISSWEKGQYSRSRHRKILREHEEIVQAASGTQPTATSPEALKDLATALGEFIRKRRAARFTIPEPVKEQVRAELNHIAEHRGPAESPLFGYREDYSQYVPRGHYTRSLKLRRYFLALTWYGRMVFVLKGGQPYGPGDEPYLVSEQEARRQTLAAAVLTGVLNTCQLPDGRSAKEVWQRMYTVTAFHVGLSDDLGPPQYAGALAAVLGEGADAQGLADPDHLREFQSVLTRFHPPAIYGGTGDQVTNRADPKALLEALDKSAGLRLMGRRFTPDAYAMGRLVHPTVGRPRDRTDMFTCTLGPAGPIRGVPRGLDVMALLGSKRARELLAALADDAYGANDHGTNLKYQAVLDQLRSEFDALSQADWNRNAYWSWLHALKPLLGEFGKGYPTFMTTPTWQTKSMTTALASWTQLRHDTTLYTKQSYSMATIGLPPRAVGGYVEPVPELYARLLALTRMTRAALDDMKVLDGQAAGRLKALEEVLARMLAISQRELADKELTEQDRRFLERFVAGATRDELRTSVVVDVHTDLSSKQVLEQATGQVDLVVVCYREPDGGLALAAGPVLSYYEFKRPMDDRLTDEQWRSMLRARQAPNRPEWVAGYLAK